MASLIQKYYEDYASPLLGQLALNDQFLSTPLTFAVTAFTVTALIPTSYLRIKHTLEELSKQTNDPNIRKKRSLLHEKFHESKLPEKIDYIVIGSGMGGLSSAAILARLGYKVVVLEQHHDVVGGGTHMFDLKGYSFDSGLHYTVPWSIPLLALTCLKKPKDCIPFDLMTENDGTIDRLYLTPHNNTDSTGKNDFLNPLRMKYHESHLKDLYKQYPNDHEDINNFILLSNRSMNFVKIFLFSRLLPKCLQSIYWKLIPSSIMETAQSTAEELLPKYIKNKQLISIFSSMWIDTGCRPDNASFMLTASVFRGISLEGGCYPRGGSTELAKELVTTIESNGGKVFIRANVEKILFNDTIQRVDRVQLKNGQIIHALKGIISATGYHNTMNNLIDSEVADRYGVVRSLPIKQSAGFVMANIGINASPEYIGATKSNTWHIPTNENGDIFPVMEEYFKNPLKPNSPIPAFITFPSVKDISYNEQEKNKTSCQMLLMAEYDWFKQYLPEIVQEKLNKNEYHTYDHNDRDKENYEKLKEIWKERILEIFLHYFPKAKDHLAVVDISTPLSIEYYLRATHGAAVGIDCTPARFCDPVVRENLDPISKIPGLALTGQDTAICGVTLCQLAGVITALRLEGFHAAVKILLQSILLGNK